MSTIDVYGLIPARHETLPWYGGNRGDNALHRGLYAGIRPDAGGFGLVGVSFRDAINPARTWTVKDSNSYRVGSFHGDAINGAASGGCTLESSEALHTLVGTGDFAMAFLVRAGAAAGVTQILVGETGGATLMGIASSGWYSWIGGFYADTSVRTTDIGKMRTVVWMRTGGTVYLIVDGIVASLSSSSSIGGTGNFRLLCRANAGDFPWNGELAGFLFWNRGLTLKEAAEVRTNFFGVFPPAASLLIPAANGGTDLQAASVVISTASGSLTTAIPLAGSSAAVGTAAGSLTTGKPLAGAASASAGGSGQLSTQITFQGSALAAALATGSLQTGSALSGDATAQAVASATLTTQIRLTGDAAAVLIASGTLAGGAAALQANAQAVASATGSLTTGKPLAGVAVAASLVAGVLTTQITLSGAALAQAVASGGLSVGIQLQAAATAQASASGSLFDPSDAYLQANIRTRALVAGNRLRAQVSGSRLRATVH